MPGRKIAIVAEEKILAANDRLAEGLHARFNAAGIYTINVLSAPGSGKTTLLERLLPMLKAKLPSAVIEGDQATARDAARIAATGAPVVQINTGGGCHLDASMVSAALNQLDLAGIKALFIENVGNMICPAEVALGEHLRLALLSVAEGDDKVAKYPTLFSAIDAVIINKVDLLPYVTFDMAKVRSDLKRFKRKVKIFELSAWTGEGMKELAEWVVARAANKRG